MTIYEISNSELIPVHLSDSDICHLDESKHLIVKQLNSNYVCIINSFNNKCIVIRASDWNNAMVFPKELVDVLRKSTGPSMDINLPPTLIDATRRTTTFIIALSYACNLKCTYCYQQHNEKLNKEKITKENLTHILSTILRYKERYPEKEIRIGLFGGEPLLPVNRDYLLEIFEFCLKHKFPVHITTNGTNLPLFLNDLIVYRCLNMTINTTIDSLYGNEDTRKTVNKQVCGNTSMDLLSSIKKLINSRVYVTVEANIDKHNIHQIENMIEFYRENHYLDNEFFHFGLGRVDDRLYETKYADILSDTDILLELQKITAFPKNVYAAFIKSPYELCRKIGQNYNQLELKTSNNYCWASAPVDDVFYIDPHLDTFRCTFTVGRKELSLFKFNIDNLQAYARPNRTYMDYPKCSECTIGGYCSGGCALSAKVDFDTQCRHEKESFDRFLDKIFYPCIIKMIDQMGVAYYET